VVEIKAEIEASLGFLVVVETATGARVVVVVEVRFNFGGRTFSTEGLGALAFSRPQRSAPPSPQTRAFISQLAS
jgi:hypothetical protein